jgi:hypothetical protein
MQEEGSSEEEQEEKKAKKTKSSKDNPDKVKKDKKSRKDKASKAESTGQKWHTRAYPHRLLTMLLLIQVGTFGTRPRPGMCGVPWRVAICGAARLQAQGRGVRGHHHPLAAGTLPLTRYPLTPLLSSLPLSLSSRSSPSPLRQSPHV